MEEYLPPCKLTIMVFLHLKLFLPQEYIPLCECFSIISMEEYLPPCKLTTMVFLHLKLILTTRINTSVRVFFNYFYGRIYTSIRVDYNGIFTLETVFTIRIYTSVQVFFNFSLKNIKLCMSWKHYLPEEYTPLYECFSISSVEEYLCVSWL